ncbi:hypothetical protein [Algoriphagus marinus]|uniref:hypothetical protein n=1 Tax=Algoriphagus marinus TaxID=1925762 RepID=UPI00094B9F71|nr:hypothetical protein [Algoriphagus marinus]
MENDDLIKSFFEDMRTKDQNLEIPAFPKPKTRSINWIIPVGIAASLFLAGFLFFEKEPEAEAPAEVIIITLEEGPNQEQQFKIQESTYLDTWESGTSSLLTEF